MKRLYFDYNASAPLSPVVKDKIEEWVQKDYKNPSSVHQDGQAAKAVVENARRTILNLVGAGPEDRLIFTSGGTEANNTMIRSAYKNRGPRNKYLLTEVEHSSVYNCAKELEKDGVELVWIKTDRNGEIDLDDYQSKLTSDVFMVSVMFSNNETGFIFPIKQMAELARERDIPFHTDAVCSLGKWPINFKELGADYLTFSSHKFGGLKGVGGLVNKKGSKVSPYIFGGSHEMNLRAGTENVWGIASSAIALEFALNDLHAELERQRYLRNKIKVKIKELYQNICFIEAKENLPQTLCASFAGLNGNLLLTNLDLEGVSASYGSACASGSLEVSRAMSKMSLKFDEARAALRFSFGRSTLEEDVDELILRLGRVIDRMG